MTEWKAREINWDQDIQSLKDLFATTWKGHPITTTSYFNWHLIENYKGKAIISCAEPIKGNGGLAGVYIVIPTSVLFNEQKFNFSISMYTITHPSYYRKGIFKGLAELTYDKCSKIGIIGTVGVPNNQSLPGFSKGLGFEVIGQFELLTRIASPFQQSYGNIKVRKITSEKELKNIDLSLDQRKVKAGVTLGERSADFIRWRFFQCPTVSYHVYLALDAKNSVTGLMVLRKAKKRGLPITVIVDFMLDGTNADYGCVAKALLAAANRYAWKSFSPLIVTLVNPFSIEANLLSKNGYKKLSKKILPHDCNFIFK
ncbi:MAG: GNAT family N-acetyltransferase, partial [Candidatus Heimdallarchaeaceae archaeon]